jgi:seryl-tRNA synthetase
MSGVPAVTAEQRALRDALIREGLLIDMGVDGLYGRGAVFERIAAGLDRAIDAAIADVGADAGTETMRFPPGFGRWQLEKSGYLKSFPHLAGMVTSFAGSDRDHRSLLDTLDQGGDWTKHQTATAVALSPAACYAAYPVLARRGPLAEMGAWVDVSAWCFRHEPSLDPCRQQMFRMREHVRAGTAAQVLQFREQWMKRGQDFVSALGLSFHIDVANDPFFGRTGKLMAASQREESLKFELLVPVTSTDKPTACLSFNYHRDVLGSTWGLKASSGGAAHTACAAFGIDRLVLALLARHGFDPVRWPAGVRSALGL